MSYYTLLLHALTVNSPFAAPINFQPKTEFNATDAHLKKICQSLKPILNTILLLYDEK